jgi:hypothetical protein
MFLYYRLLILIKAYVFCYVERRQSSHVRRHLVDGEADVMQFALPFPLVALGAAGGVRRVHGGGGGGGGGAARVGIVLLRHADHHVTLGGAAGARNLDVELRIHGRRFCKTNTKL